MIGQRETFPLVPRRRVAGTLQGTLRSFRRGPGTDRAGLRPYRVGDDVRRIDHRASGRISSARATDEFVVREDLTEDRGRVVLVVDRRPAMALFPDELPWLSKPRAILGAGRLVVATALEHACHVGYLDEGKGRDSDPGARAGSPFWRPADGTTEAYRVTERYLTFPGFGAQDGSVGRSLRFLCGLERGLPAGAFVFVLSDFLDGLDEGAFSAALARGWDLVPVVLQDPRWEQSFPEVGGTAVPIADPASGRTRLVRLGAREAAARRAEHEQRLAQLLVLFGSLGLDWVLLSDDAPTAVHDAFEAWAVGRRLGARISR